MVEWRKKDWKDVVEAIWLSMIIGRSIGTLFIHIASQSSPTPNAPTHPDV